MRITVESPTCGGIDSRRRGPRVAIVTCVRLPRLAPDDLIAVAALERRGAQVVPCVWSDSEVAWRDFDAVLIRSTWDYHLRVGEFRSWLEMLERMRVPVWNPLPVLRWNLDKSYLDVLAARGVPTLRTRRVRRGSALTLSALIGEEDWDQVVIKPPVSASAFRTFRVQREDVPSFEDQFFQVLSQSDVLVQQFQSEIVTEGEWSVCFFGGEFSHAVLKRPREGDFRTQPELGGSRRQMIPPPTVLAGSAAVLAQAEASTLYARVDGIVSDGAFRLMELELIEPSLYFDGDGAAAGRFADAALRLVR